MNESNARAVEVYGGYVGEYRLIHKARWQPVLCNGKACIYQTSSEAEVAAWRELNEKRYPPIRADGEKVSSARTKAEELFGSIFRRGKKIPVERR